MKQYLYLAAAVGLLLSHVTLGYQAYRRGHEEGSLSGREAVAAQLAEGYTRKAAALQAEASAAKKINQELQDKLANIPAATTTVRTIIRDHPTSCAVPPAVSDGLQQHAAALDALRAEKRGGSR